MNKFLTKRKKERVFLFLCLIVLNTALFIHILDLEKNKELLRIDFLNIGQGDASLITLPSGAQIMVDGGPNPQVTLQELSRILSPFDRTIDLIISSHPQEDHIGGLPEILRRYRVGAYVSNGQKNKIGVYDPLMESMQKEGIPNIVLSRGDRIHYRDSIIEILNPANTFDKNLNENSIVLLVKSASTTALFTGDISAKMEKSLLEVRPLNIDVLKVAHHGSKYSSSKKFLETLKPKIAIIQVGEENRFGHPSKETLKRLKDINAKIFQNNKNGTITILSNSKKLYIKKEK